MANILPPQASLPITRLAVGRARWRVDFSLHPQNDLQPSAAFEAELQELTRQARAEILTRGRSILAWCGPANGLVRDVHRLAGLAGQFGAPEVATAADLLEVELAADTKDPNALKALDHALTQFAMT